MQLLFRLTLALFVGSSLARMSHSQEGQPKSSHKYTNELIDSTSPYLLQHAHNPVNWMPWGPEAFERAKRENKPIFVSIGYSTCYWCHVMERESFENEEVAKVLNSDYIAIKVDREERPDIDEQLMLATQLMTGRGGWPNSVWLTSDGRPWMAGTYFPRKQFIDALSQLSAIWKTQRENVEKQADSLTRAIREASRVDRVDAGGSNSSGKGALSKAIRELGRIYDHENSGFGGKPKFPPHRSLLLLAYQARQAKDGDAVDMLTGTLDAMYCGGVHDHVGGGFHRYSTDERWLLPHFEKMLYDNAQLIHAYAEAYSVTKQHRFAVAVEDIVGWLEREMTHPGGGFFSAIDSESEGGLEGKYYTWSMAELQDVLGTEASLFSQAYNFEVEGNFLEEASGERSGGNIPFLNPSDLDACVVDERLDAMRVKLREARKLREYPHLDDKVLTAWNGLAIASLAKAGRILENERYTQLASAAAEFVLENLFQEGRLKRSWRADQTQQLGYLNDYAFYLDGLIELYITTGSDSWLAEAEKLAKTMIDLFEDGRRGGFYFTSLEHEPLLLRSKNMLGGGNLPNGNGVAAHALLKLHRITGKQAYLKSAQRTMKCFGDLMHQSPRSVEYLVLAEAHMQEVQAGSQHGQEGVVASFRDAAVHTTVQLISGGESPSEIAKGTIRLEIQPGFHLYCPVGDTDSDVAIQRVHCELATAKTVRLKALKYPMGKVKQDLTLGAEIVVYQDSIEIPFELECSNLGGQSMVKLILKYQACDDQRCLAPQQIPLEFEWPQ